MGKGSLVVRATAFNGALPVSGATVNIFDTENNLLHTLTTDESGLTARVELSAPPIETQFNPSLPVRPYSQYIVEISAPGYQKTVVNGVQIYDRMPSELPVDMRPGRSSQINEYNIGPNTLEMQSTRQDIPPRNMVTSQNQDVPQKNKNMGARRNGSSKYMGTAKCICVLQNMGLPRDMSLSQDIGLSRDMDATQNIVGIAPRIHREVFIPTHITVHLGVPASNARNVTVPFVDYIKNVASSEIFPDWPYNSLRANIHAIISLALNRVFTEWYRGKGYNFDITNSTQYDQYFVEGRNIFESISVIADAIFNTYVIKPPGIEPYYTEYCSGSYVTCPGMKQWGTVTLADQGLNYLQILRYYYGQSIYITSTNNIRTPFESFPGNLTIGSSGQDVALIQAMIARIRQNYPRIPALTVDGQYGSQTVAAIREFQSIFGLALTGTVDRRTWYQISNTYAAVMRLAELGSEGHQPPMIPSPPPVPPSPPSPPSEYFNYTVVAGDTLWLLAQRFGTTVEAIMSLNGLTSSNLNIGQVLRIPGTTSSGYFNYTVAAGDTLWLLAQRFGTTVEAIMSLNGLTSSNLSIGQVLRIPSGTTTVPRPPFPGILRLGSSGNNVTILQQNLNRIAAANSAIPRITVDGSFGPATQNAVIAFQRYYGLTPDGIVGSLTWNRLMQLEV